MKKILLSSIILSGLLFANQLSYLPLDKKFLSEENGGDKPAIESYSDGIGLYTVGKFQIDNRAMNELVFKFGEEAKKNGETLKEHVLEKGNNKEKNLAEKLGSVAENIIPSDGTNCNDNNANTENDIYVNGICKGEPILVKSCYNILKLNLSNGNGYYNLTELIPGENINVYCDMNNGGWTLIGKGPQWFNIKKNNIMLTDINSIFNENILKEFLKQNGILKFSNSGNTLNMYIKDNNMSLEHSYVYTTNSSSIEISKDLENWIIMSTKEINCSLNAIGKHSCGYNNGWILLHNGETYGVGHPLPVGKGLDFLWFK